MDPRINIFY